MLSVVIPVFNEEENIKPLYYKLKGVLKGIPNEIIFVDDGSTDSTFSILHSIKEKNVRIIKLRKNFGQTASTDIGFKHAKGDIIVVMDGDLQNDPADIPLLLKKMEEGYDVVSGWRHKRKDPLGKRLFSRISNSLASHLTGVKLHDFGCSLKAYRKETVKDLNLHGEMHRYIPALIAVNGFRIGEVEVSHHPRHMGKTKYGWGRLTKGFLDLLYIKFWTDYSARPLHFFGRLGIYSLFLGFLIAVVKLLQLLIWGIPLQVGPLTLLSAMMVILSFQFLSFGFLSEMLIRKDKKDAENKIEKIL